MKNLLVEIINEIREGKGKEKISLHDVLENTDLRNDLGLESLDLAVLTVKIEDITNIDIFENGIVTTVGDILTVLNNQK